MLCYIGPRYNHMPLYGNLRGVHFQVQWIVIRWSYKDMIWHIKYDIAHSRCSVLENTAFVTAGSSIQIWFSMHPIHICNLSFKRGVFPMQLKIANVVPLYKTGNEHVFSNYRPVLVLPVFSKLLERLMYIRLMNFITNNKLLYKYQFGFQKGKSTYMALILLIDRITEALDKGDCVVGTYLDFSKAFDTVNYEILLQKLSMYGIQDIALEWFRDYLTNRSQYVTYNFKKSAKENITCGVPQGSILGPLLFWYISMI